MHPAATSSAKHAAPKHCFRVTAAALIIAGVLSGTGVGSAQTRALMNCAPFGVVPAWCQKTRQMSAPSGKTPAGPPVNGVALSLTPASAYNRVGSPIWIVVELRNVSTQVVTGRRSGLPDASSYDFSVTRVSDGTPVARIAADPQTQLTAFTTLGGAFGMAAGSSSYAAVHLDLLYPLSAGRYSVHLTESALDLMGKSAGFVPLALSSNTIVLDVLPPRGPGPGAPHPNAVYEDAPTNNPIGRAVRGFALSFPGSRSWTMNLGDALFLTLELRNLTEKPHDVSFGNRARAYDFLIVNDRTHKVVPRVVPADAGYDRSPLESRAVRLYPDTALFARFELTKLYHFTAAGPYTIRVRYGHPTVDGKPVALESNPIHLTLRYVPHTTYLTENNAGHVFTIKLESLRPAYVAGQPIRLRVTLTNDTDFVTWTDAAPPWWIVKLSVLDARGEAFPGFGRGGARLGISVIRFYPNVPAVLSFQDPSAMRTHPQWADFTRWGYDRPPAGAYTLYASDIHGEQVNHSTITRFETTADRSNLLRVEVLSNDDPRRTTEVKLAEPQTDASLRDIAKQYTPLRARLESIVPQIKDLNDVNALLDIGYYRWTDDVNALTSRVDRLPSAGNPDSAYVQVTANVWEALHELSKAGDNATQACGQVRSAATLQVADYYQDAVIRELDARNASLADTANPPVEATPTPNCR